MRWTKVWLVLACVLVTAPAFNSLCYGKAKEWKDLYDEMVLAFLWHQSADESKALSWQTFNMARDILDEQLRLKPDNGKKPILVTDIDDTLTDSSSYFAGFLGTNDGLNEKRDYIWWDEQPSAPKAGALAFLRYAVNKGVEPFYLTGRTADPKVEQYTHSFLQRLGVPGADPNHIKISNGIKKDQFIRDIVGESNQLLLTVGDKFSDLGVESSNKTDHQLQWLQEHPSQPGITTLLQANPVGGTWDCLSHNVCPHSPDQEYELRQQQRKQMAGDYVPSQDVLTPSPLFSGNQMGQILKWQTESSEHAFISRQVFNRAGLYWKNRKAEKGEAIVIDIDGTLIDLAPFTAMVLLWNTGKKGINLFHHWAKSSPSQRAMPGAREYLELVKSAGGEIFYVTARSTIDEHGKDMRKPLLDSLERAGVPLPADKNHLLMKGDFCIRENCSKAARFENIRMGIVSGAPVNIVQLLGDTLQDIELVGEDLETAANAESTGVLADLGRSRFLLPNPIYIRGWLFRLYQKWYGDNWHEEIDSETLQAGVLKKIQRWNPGVSILE
ncbi:hypothetical protein M3P05_15415 [Sansalvadorimonas sp. 2012CJ34-2]|uniref:Acid phosphatase n=1 Tax=Parendozoicomonas callyspongiae TaxID=2942213 RepID=A0ABT0PKR5_9GAMM|nr:HAD family acid phosphatase [Sansalvadorimonas sp. 2012CJ34-2]MCL6271312.1 hypothetical protein [Sansalvadorimonas sp. 2012CJ34-2]